MVDTPAGTRDEKLAALAGDLMRHPPRMLVFGLPPGGTHSSANALLAGASLTKWIAGNYWSAIGTDDDDLQVLILNSPADTPATRQRVAVELMQTGLDCFYAKGDYKEAELYFRSVLQLNSQYYGAYFQLGKTLDILGRTADARKVWIDFYPMAQQARDNASLEFAARRLGITLRPPSKPTP
jgi:tetratricopeptide (TPR) repeat protein